MATKKSERVVVTGEPVDVPRDVKPFDPEKPLENVEKPLETEFFEAPDAANPQPAGVDGSLEYLQSDGEPLIPAGDAKTKHSVKVQDRVFYCRGMKDTGRKDKDGNRILEPDYAPATVYEVDEDNKKTGHVLLVYEAENGAKLGAYAHNAEGVPGYYTHKEPK